VNEEFLIDKEQVQMALEHLNIDPLIDRLNHLIKIFGGEVYAFDMEWKIRLFVVEVLDFALVSGFLDQQTFQLKENSGLKFKSNAANRGLKIDGEKAIEQFSQRVQPDLTVSTYDNKEMKFVIEIKNLRCNKGKAIIKQAVCENFKQLRNYCLSKKKDEMAGISTNFGVWIFTHYLKKEEMLCRPSF